MEFRYSEIIDCLWDFTNFIYDSKTYDTVKLDSDSLKFYLSLDSSFFSV